MTFSVTVRDRCDVEEIRQTWTALASRCPADFFLSWRWIGTWLSMAADAPILVTAAKNGEIKAAGLLRRSRRRNTLLTARQLCLHESGDAVRDSPMIEYNGFLAPPDGQDAEIAILRHLRAQVPGWDEIWLGGVRPSMMETARAAGLAVVTDRISPTFAADLQGGTPWRAGLSQGLRAQLKQSRAFAERDGELRLDHAASTEQSLEFFDRMAVLHADYWKSRNQPGAFATPYARDFHRRLIAAEGGGAEIQLSRLAAGNIILGYLYNFRAEDTVYAYQSGFTYLPDNRHRPGLLAHALAIEDAAAKGRARYDFLAGDAPYKARLGRKTGHLVWLRAQRNTPLLALERSARRLKNLAFRRT